MRTSWCCSATLWKCFRGLFGALTKTATCSAPRSKRSRSSLPRPSGVCPTSGLLLARPVYINAHGVRKTNTSLLEKVSGLFGILLSKFIFPLFSLLFQRKAALHWTAPEARTKGYTRHFLEALVPRFLLALVAGSSSLSLSKTIGVLAVSPGPFVSPCLLRAAGARLLLLPLPLSLLLLLRGPKECSIKSRQSGCLPDVACLIAYVYPPGPCWKKRRTCTTIPDCPPIAE